METNNYLETESIGKLMRKYTFPCVVSMLVAALYNIVDQIFIANADYLGSNGNAANTVVFPMTIIALAIAVMIGNGCCAFVSISLGSKKRKDAELGIGNAVISVVVVSLVLTALYLIFWKPIISMFGATVNETTFAFSKEYFFWITIGIPFYMFSQAMNPIIRSDGNQAYAMAMLLVGAIFNIIFDPICIYVLKWGMMGAALATIGGQFLSAVLGAAYLFRMKAVPLNKHCFVFQWRVTKKFLSLGVSDFFSQFAIVFSMMATINMAVKYGAADPIFGQPEYSQIPTAIAGIVSKFFQVIISVSIGLAAGCTPIAGFNFGAKRYDRVLGIMKRLLITEALFGLVMSVIFLIFPNQLMLIFGSAKEGVYYTQFAAWFIRCQLFLLPLACVNKSCFIFLQALGKAKEATALSVTREFILGVGLTLLIPMIWGLYALPFFMPAADTLSFIAIGIVLLRVRKELRKMQETAAAEPAAVIAEPAAESFVDASKPALTDKIIAIGRSYGSGGRSVGKLLAQKLNIPYYDAALLEETAKRSGLSNKYLAGIEEKPLNLDSYYKYVGFLYDHDSLPANIANRAQREVIEYVAQEGACVIVGRRADLILAGNPNLISVFVTSSMESAVHRVADRDKLSESESAAKIKRVNRERADYYNQYSENHWGEAQSYNICVDTDRFGIEGAVGIIMNAATIAEE